MIGASVRLGEHPRHGKQCSGILDCCGRFCGAALPWRGNPCLGNVIITVFRKLGGCLLGRDLVITRARFAGCPQMGLKASLIPGFRM
jgi:hypothetical protein